MQVIHERCCGLDVHKKSVTACVLITAPGRKVQKQVRTFPTTTVHLLALADWLTTLDIRHVAMESTGVYWRPVYNILEADCEIVLVNAQHIKAVPGRKTDVKDAEWLADLLRHGLLKPSFIPPVPIRELRELTRYRKTLIGQRAQEVNRLHKVLESANIKLGMVVTDVLGVSGRTMLEAIVGGEQDPHVLAELACGSLRKKLPELQLALEGRLTAHHRVLIGKILAHITFLEESIAQIQMEIDRRLVPFGQAVALLQTIPGVSAQAAATIIAEIGIDMCRFPSAKHLANWAGLCPGNRQSGGKHFSGKPTQGNAWLKAVLGEVAWVITRLRAPNYLTAQYHRIARRRGRYKALVAVAHSLLVIAYHMLKTKQPYTDLGADYFDRLDVERIQRHHVNRLKALGYEVELKPKVAQVGFS
jgi:transposase